METPDLPIPGTVPIEYVIAWVLVSIIGVLPLGSIARGSATVGVDLKGIFSGVVWLVRLFLSLRKKPPSAGASAAIVFLSLTGCAGTTHAERRDATVEAIREAGAAIDGVTPEEQKEIRRGLGNIAEWIASGFKIDKQKVCGSIGTVYAFVQAAERRGAPVEPGVQWGVDLAVVACQYVPEEVSK